MKVTIQPNKPVDYHHETGVMGVANEYEAQNPYLRGNIFIGVPAKRGVAFKFSNFSGPVRVIATLRPTGSSQVLAEKKFDAIKGQEFFVVFEGFPSSYRPNSADYEVIMFNMHDSDSDAKASLQMFSRR